MPRGRPVLSRGTKQRKKEFDSKLSAYSLTALNNVIEIAEKAFNTVKIIPFSNQNKNNLTLK